LPCWLTPQNHRDTRTSHCQTRSHHRC
jgi:hypothetical protein